jgi:hypothetical protein
MKEGEWLKIMKNRIVAISSAQYQRLRDELKYKSIFIAEIEGKEISDLSQFLEAIWEAFQFPNTGHVNYYAYLDWIRDLDWLNAKGFALIIKDSTAFMDKDVEKRNIVLGSLEQEVLTWWESDIEQFQVQGKARPFNVYFVD